MKLLIVEDDPSIRHLMRTTLEHAGYDVDVACDGLEAADAIMTQHYALIILDVMLPKYDAYDLMPLIKDSNTPVLMVTALATIDDKIKGFDVGVEDYLTKPFEIAELLARVKIIMRRYHPEADRLEYKHIVLEPKTQRVYAKGKEISLTPMEFKLLKFLIDNVGMALSRDYLLETLWGVETEETRTLDLHIQRLRKKLDLETSIRTIFKFGYILDKAL